MHVHVSLNIEIEASANLSEMEQQIQVAGQQAMREALKQTIRQWEEQSTICPHCGGKQRRLEGTVRRSIAMTFGRVPVPRRRFRCQDCTDVIALAGHTQDEVLALAASVERDSEHPLAEAVRQAAAERMLALCTPEQFEALPGLGVRAEVNGAPISVGNARMMASSTPVLVTQALERQGKTLLLVEQAGTMIGVLAASDTIRSEVPAALERLRALGIHKIELLTGDHERTAEAQATALRITSRAELLPEDKIRIVKEYQAQGHTVVMIGDEVNDAPALAQADVGIAMGVMGSDVALEAAHVALMREDWHLVPDLFMIAKRTMHVVKMNLSFTVIYNLVGLTLAALGFLPPVLAAAAQSLPDLGILANSSRLLRQQLPSPPIVPSSSAMPEASD